MRRDLLARSCNAFGAYAKHTTSDTDIVVRRWLPIDLDPVRPAGISSTDQEHNEALARASQVRDYLAECGWPESILADSGNGGHLLHRVELPNDADSSTLIKRFLEALGALFDDEHVKIDRTTYNPARIWKLYGTPTRKGDSLPDRPHRLSRILEVPNSAEVVTRALVEKIAALLPETEPRSLSKETKSRQPFDLDHWIAEHSISVRRALPWNNGRKWILEYCVFDESHRGTSAAIIQLQNGAIAYCCRHNSCADRKWQEVRDSIEPGWRKVHVNASTQSAPAGARRALLTRFSEIAAESLNWLWRDRFPLGKLSLLVGDPGLGKSLVTLYVAACISNGADFTDGAPCEQGSVVVLSAEDGAADTVRPRLDALGADVTRIHRLTIQSGNDETLFSFEDDLKLLDQTLDRLANVRAVIVDPMTAYLGDTDPNKDARVRSLLAPLAALAERWRVAVIGVMHLNKAAVLDAVYRVTGSVAFIAQARAAWVIVQDPADSNRRLFLKLKANLSPANVPGLAFALEDKGGVASVAWQGETDINCRDVLGGFSNSSKRGRAETLEQARAILGEILADGPVLSKKIFDEANQRGVSKRSVERACKDLDVHSFRSPADGKWWKALPGNCLGDGCPRSHTSREQSGGVEENPWGTRAKTNSAKGDGTGGLGTAGEEEGAGNAGGQNNSANYLDTGGVDPNPSRELLHLSPPIS